jgi:hypothetical protein
MLTPTQVQEYVKARPFRPFRLNMASGKTFDIRHPEMIKVAKSCLYVFSFATDEPEIAEKMKMVSLMLTESISHLEMPVNA